MSGIFAVNAYLFNIVVARLLNADDSCGLFKTFFRATKHVEAGLYQ